MTLADWIGVIGLVLCWAVGVIMGIVIAAPRRRHEPSPTDLIHAWRAECAQHEKGSTH